MPNPARTLTITLTLGLLALAHATSGPLDSLRCQGTTSTSACNTAPGPLDHPTALTPEQLIQHLIDHDQHLDAIDHAHQRLPHADPSERDRIHFLLGLAEHALQRHDRAAIAFASIHERTFSVRYNHAISSILAGTNAADNLLHDLWNAVLTHHHDGTPISNDPPPQPNPHLRTAAALIPNALSALHSHHHNHLAALEQTNLLRALDPDPAHTTRYLQLALEIFPPAAAIAAIERDAPSDQRDLLLARAYDRAAMPDLARSYYRRAHEAARLSDDVPTLLEVARHQHHDRRPNDSLATLEHAHAIDPHHHDTHHLLGLHHERHGEPRNALEHYLLAERFGAPSAGLTLRIAVAALAAGEHHLAYARAQEAQAQAKAYEQAHDRDPLDEQQHHDLHLTISRAANALGHTDHALQHAHHASHTPAATPATHLYSGDLHYHHQHFETALEHYRHLHDHLDARDLTQRTYHALSALERHGEAITALERHLRDHPEHADAWHWLGWSHAHRNDSDQALSAWRRAAHLEHSDALELLRRLE